jgi:hypothetical protein
MVRTLEQIARRLDTGYFWHGVSRVAASHFASLPGYEVEFMPSWVPCVGRGKWTPYRPVVHKHTPRMKYRVRKFAAMRLALMKPHLVKVDGFWLVFHERDSMWPAASGGSVRDACRFYEQHFRRAP